MILQVKPGAQEGVQLLDAVHVDEGRGQETAQADIQDEASLDHLDDLALDGLVLDHALLELVPRALVLGPLLGEDEPPFLVLFLQDKGVDLVPYLHHFLGLHAVAYGQLPCRDHPLGFVSDVQENLVLVHLDHGTRDDVALREDLDGLVVVGDFVIGVVEVGQRGGQFGDLSGVDSVVLSFGLVQHSFRSSNKFYLPRPLLNQVQAHSGYILALLCISCTL